MNVRQMGEIHHSKIQVSTTGLRKHSHEQCGSVQARVKVLRLSTAIRGPCALPQESRQVFLGKLAYIHKEHMLSRFVWNRSGAMLSSADVR